MDKLKPVAAIAMGMALAGCAHHSSTTPEQAKQAIQQQQKSQQIHEALKQQPKYTAATFSGLDRGIDNYQIGVKAPAPRIEVRRPNHVVLSHTPKIRR